MSLMGLLYYLSHIGELGWEKFKDTVKNLTREEPNLKYSTYLTSLARLGHLDYDPMNLDKVVIAPSILVEAAVEDRYVLVGGRSPDFLKDIKRYISKTGGKLHLIPEQYAPTTIALTELTEASFTEIENLGIHISQSIFLPSCQAYCQLRNARLSRKSKHRFPILQISSILIP